MLFLVKLYLNILSITTECVCVCVCVYVCVWGGGGGIGDQLLSLVFSEIDLFLLHLTCGRGGPVSAQLDQSSYI